MRSSSTTAVWLTTAFLAFAGGLVRTATAQGITGPDEQVGPAYLRLWKDCRDDLRRRSDIEETAVICEKLSREADRFLPETHPVTRRTAYVLYATALTQTEAYLDASRISDKAVAIVEKQRDSGSGAAAAYYARGRARGLSGDLNGADADLDLAEAAHRKALAGTSDVFQRVEYIAGLKRDLEFHSQILEAMHRSEAAEAKNEEAAKL